MSKGLGMGYTGYLRIQQVGRAWGRQSAWGWSPVTTNHLSVTPQKATQAGKD